MYFLGGNATACEYKGVQKHPTYIGILILGPRYGILWIFRPKQHKFKLAAG